MTTVPRLGVPDVSGDQRIPEPDWLPEPQPSPHVLMGPVPLPLSVKDEVDMARWEQGAKFLGLVTQRVYSEVAPDVGTFTLYARVPRGR